VRTNKQPKYVQKIKHCRTFRDFSGLAKATPDSIRSFEVTPFNEREAAFGEGDASPNRPFRFRLFFFIPVGLIGAIIWSVLQYGDVNVRLHKTAIIAGDSEATLVYQDPDFATNLDKQFKGDAVSLGGCDTPEDVQEFVKEANAEYRAKLTLLRDN
jgi:hypothetical protein